jgi:cell division protein FtsB
MRFRRERPGEKVARVAQAGEATHRPIGFAVWVGIVLAATVGLVAVTFFPLRQYLNQRHDVATARQHLAVITQENQHLASEVQALNTDAEIERVAREQYHLVKPGEDAYAILPPSAPASLPDQWPYNLVKAMLAAKS